MEKIIGITEVKDISKETLGYGSGFSNLVNGESLSWGSYDGYEILTDRQLIYVLIDNGQSCCESWGYLASDDDLTQFEDAELLSISIVDEGYNERMIEAGRYLDEGGIVFVNFNTSNGVFQLACYNGHNGYYGHDVVVITNQIKENISV